MTPPNPEAKAREKIDAQLAARGWVVQNYADMDFGAGCHADADCREAIECAK